MKYIAVFLLLFFSVSAQSQSLQVSPPLMQWDKVPNADTIIHSFTVTSSSGAEQSGTFAVLDQSGKYDTLGYPFSIVEGNSFTIAGGETQTFHILWVPNGVLGGNWQDTVYLRTSGAPPFARFIIYASRYNVNTGNVQYSTVDLDFGTIMAGTVDSEFVKAKNVGATVLTVTANTLVHTGPFALFEGKSIHARPINPGDSLQIGLRFMPLVAGAFHDTLKTQSNDLDHPNVAIALRGIATPAMRVVIGKSNSGEVFPSIASSSITVQTGSASGATVRIVDLLGREDLRAQFHSAEETLDLSSLTNGVYLCLVESATSTETYRFVIRK